MTVLKSLKHEWGLEPYINLLPLNLRKNLTRLRISSHRLPIETGRYERPIIPRNERYCKVCTTSGYPKRIGDESHLLFQCVIGTDKRLKLQGDLKNSINTQDLSVLFQLRGISLIKLGVYGHYWRKVALQLENEIPYISDKSWFICKKRLQTFIKHIKKIF